GALGGGDEVRPGPRRLAVARAAPAAQAVEAAGGHARLRETTGELEHHRGRPAPLAVVTPATAPGAALPARLGRVAEHLAQDALGVAGLDVLAVVRELVGPFALAALDVVERRDDPLDVAHGVLDHELVRPVEGEDLAERAQHLLKFGPYFVRGKHLELHDDLDQLGPAVLAQPAEG